LECHLVEGLSQLLKLPRVQYAFQREACECKTMIILLVVDGREINLHNRCSRHNAGQTNCKAKHVGETITEWPPCFPKIRVFASFRQGCLKVWVSGYQSHKLLKLVADELMTTTTYYNSNIEILDTILVKKNDDERRQHTNERWITPGSRLNDDASIEFTKLQSMQV